MAMPAIETTALSRGARWAVLAAAFAGVAAAFGANVLVKPIDGILAEMTNDAAHVVDPNKSIALTATGRSSRPSQA